MSGASGQANGHASGPVPSTGFLVVLNQSGLVLGSHYSNGGHSIRTRRRNAPANLGRPYEALWARIEKNTEYIAINSLPHERGNE